LDKIIEWIDQGEVVGVVGQNVSYHLK